MQDFAKKNAHTFSADTVTVPLKVKSLSRLFCHHFVASSPTRCHCFVFRSWQDDGRVKWRGAVVALGLGRWPPLRWSAWGVRQEWPSALLVGNLPECVLASHGDWALSRKNKPEIWRCTHLGCIWQRSNSHKEFKTKMPKMSKRHNR